MVNSNKSISPRFRIQTVENYNLGKENREGDEVLETREDIKRKSESTRKIQT